MNMSGEADTTADGTSVESDLIWTDNPEMAYFRSMVTSRRDEPTRPGLDPNDSLLGDHLRDDEDEDEDGEADSGDLFPSQQRALEYRFGLGDAETDTVDNIYLEEDSILVVDRSANLTSPKDDESKEPGDNQGVGAAIAISTARPTRHLDQDHPDPDRGVHHQPGNGNGNQGAQDPDPQVNLLSFQRYSVGDDVDIVVRRQQQQQQPESTPAIPGFIFVTDGHPSFIETRTTENLGGTGDDKMEQQFRRRLALFLAVLIMLAGTIVGVLVARNRVGVSLSSNSESNSSMSMPGQGQGPTGESTRLVPTATPTIAPSRLRAPADRPTRPITEAPTPDPVSVAATNDPEKATPEQGSGLETEVPTRLASPVPNADPTRTVLPAASPTASPSLSSSEEEATVPIESPTSVSLSAPTTAMTTAMTTSAPEESTGNPLPATSAPSSQVAISDSGDGTGTTTSAPEESTGNPLPATSAPSSQVAISDPGDGTGTEPPTVLTTGFSSQETSCVPRVSTDRTCYRNGVSMEITFRNCNPTAGDWIGIFPAGRPVTDLRQPLTWIWACGNQFCDTPVASGVATLYRVQGSGEFRIYLLRDNNGVDDDDNGNETGGNSGFSAYSIGNEFTVNTRCN